MSAALYPTGLFWCGADGTARHDGVFVERLRQAPPVVEHLVGIRFAPCVRIAEIRISAHEWRPMTSLEIARANAYLARLAACAHHEASL